MPVRTRAASAALVLALAATLSACSSSGEESDAADRAGGSVLEVAHVHGLGIDPADGRLYVATHDGVFSVGKKGKARRVSNGADYMGFTVAGPGTFLGSGHPAPGGDAPSNRGLIESTDAGRTWNPVSLSGEADFHALAYNDGTVYGYDGTIGALRVSPDGEKWDTRAEIAALDIAVDPQNPDAVLATTQDGVARSSDGGTSFSPGRGPVLAFLSWGAPEALYGITPNGELMLSADGGKTWEKTGTVPGGSPQALTAVDGKRVLAATQDGVYESRDGGKTFTKLLDIASGHH